LQEKIQEHRESIEKEVRDKLEALKTEKDEEISKLQETIEQKNTIIKNSQKMISNLRKQLEPLRVSNCSLFLFDLF
jgi:septal ring factor EnvC (AmiA/AmiB activator)